jgi:hypothetical protein
MCPIGEHPERQVERGVDGGLARVGVDEHAGPLGHGSDPAAVVLLFGLDMYSHPFRLEPPGAPRAQALRGSWAAVLGDNATLPIGVASTNPLDMGAVVEPGVLEVRVKHTHWVGTSVVHCHLLTPGNHGMMAAFTVTP